MENIQTTDPDQIRQALNDLSFDELATLRRLNVTAWIRDSKKPLEFPGDELIRFVSAVYSQLMSQKEFHQNSFFIEYLTGMSLDLANSLMDCRNAYLKVVDAVPEGKHSIQMDKTLEEPLTEKCDAA